MKFSLFFFSSGEDPASREKYRLVIEGAKFADRNGFTSVWIPERHFSAMGCLYPRPQLLLAALARETEHLRLCAGSVLLPLHSPIQIAEEWAMLDNLSGGRAGLACATGWHPNDFVFAPDKYPNRHLLMYESIDTLRRLWKGESVWYEGGDGGQVEVRTYPTPIQSQLPLWVAAGVNPRTFIKAGEIGAHLLTHMQLHDPDELKAKIKLYHESLERHGYDPREHEVTVWVQAFLGDRADVVIEQAAAALNGWYKSDAALMFGGFAFLHKGKKIDITQLSPSDFDDYVRFVCNRLVSRNMAIFGTPETCRESIAKFRSIGVTEVACQLDFGLEPDLVLRGLSYLKELKDTFNAHLITESRAAEVRTGQAGSWRREQPEPDGTTVEQREDSLPSLPVERARDTLEDIRERCQEMIERGDFYNRYHRLGLEYGSSFQGVDRLWRRDGEVLAAVQLPAVLEPTSEVTGSHPAFIDSCVQILLAALPNAASYSRGTLYFAGLRSLRLYHALPHQVWCHAILRSSGDQGADLNKAEGDVTIFNDDGQVLGEIVGLRIRELERDLPVARQPEWKDWLYTIAWQATPRPAQGPDSDGSTTGRSGAWLIFVDSSGVGHSLRSFFEGRGETCVTVLRGDRYSALHPRKYEIDAGSPEHYQQLLQDILADEHISVAGIVHLWSLDAATPDATTLESLRVAQKVGCGSVLFLVQALTGGRLRHVPRLWLVTGGSQATDMNGRGLSIAQVPLWGLGKTIQYEYPELQCTMVDVSPRASSEEIRSLCEECRRNDRESQLVLRGERRYVARLGRWRPQLPQVGAFLERRKRLDANGAYLITGGLGSLGLEVARWMADRGARHLILIGRSHPSAPARKVLEQLEQAGIQVGVFKADVSVPEELARVLEDVATTKRPLLGVVHAAGVLDDGILQQQTWPRFARVMASKVEGAWNLHGLTRDCPLDFFVCFSSVASLLGSPGQGNYAAANAFMDGLIQYRRSVGLTGLSINWGLWSASAMAASVGSHVHKLLGTQGLGTIDPEQGLQILADLLDQDAIHVGVIPVDWSIFLEQFPAGHEPSWLRDIAREMPVREPAQRVQAPANTNIDVRVQWQAAIPSERHPLLTAYLQGLVTRVLGMNGSDVDAQQPLINLGVDSFMSIELKNAIKAGLDVDIPVVKFLEGISIVRLGTLLNEQLASLQPPPYLSHRLTDGSRIEGQLGGD